MASRTAKSGYQNPVRNSPDEPKVSEAKQDRTDEMTEQQEDVQKTVATLLNDAIDFYEDELEPDQVKATEYYKGEPFGDEKEGRSKVVNSVLRDATLAQMAPLLQMIFEGDRPVEFMPESEEDAPSAEQATDYCKYILTNDNPGFLIFWAWFMDGLVRRLGVAKHWWEETSRKTSTDYTGLTQEGLRILAADPEVEIQKGVTVTETGQGPTYDLTVFHVERQGRERVMIVPNEEIVYTPNARSFEEARIVAHVREVPVDELLPTLLNDDSVDLTEEELEDLIAESKGEARKTTSSDLDAARQFDGLSRKDLKNTELEDVCLYAEAYVTMAIEDEDYDSDEPLLPERRLFKCVGPEWKIVNGKGLGECVDGIPFADWTPIPEPHSVIGQSNWDLLKDIQRILSQIERGTLDSLAQAINPVTEVVNGMVNMADFINPEVAGLRRVRAIGQTQTIAHRFVGPDTLPMLDYYAGVVEDRTGKARGNGVDAESLQSTTKVAAAAYVTAARARVEMVARVFCETGLRKLYKGILRDIVKHQTPGRIVKLRNEYVPIDPRHWNTDMDVSVNMPIGAGSTAERIELLGGLAGKQQELLAQGSPLVSNVELRNTLADITELSGKKNVARYFKPWGEQEEQQMLQQRAEQPVPPDANMALVEVEKMKAAAEMAINEQKFQLEQWKAIQQNDLERDKLSREMALKELEIERKYQAEIDDNLLTAKVAADRAAMDADVKMEQARNQPAPAQA